MVYRGGLENRFGVTANGGSNPSLSARIGLEKSERTIASHYRNFSRSSDLCDPVAQRRFPAHLELFSRDTGRIEKMFMAELGRIERFYGGGGSGDCVAGRLHSCG